MNDWSQRGTMTTHLVDLFQVPRSERASVYSHKYSRNIITMLIHFRFVFMLGIEVLVPMIRTVPSISWSILMNASIRDNRITYCKSINWIALHFALHCVMLHSVMGWKCRIFHEINWIYLLANLNISYFIIIRDEHMNTCPYAMFDKFDVIRELIY